MRELAPTADRNSLTVSVVMATDTVSMRETVVLAAGSCVRDALSRVEFAKPFSVEGGAETDEQLRGSPTHPSESNVGIWGKRVLLNTALAHGDRIELYRPITADAKSARLARASEQGYRQGRNRRAVK